MKRFLIILVLAGMFVLPVHASQLKGTDNMPVSGTTSVTAHVEGSSESVEDGNVKTGDNSHWESYLLLFLMSGIVIVSSAINRYRKEI